ncbi:MAG: heme lyase CcmF/NrfE family subunit [Anaerolineales bacterium]|nr:heme lyase CcmF/NrfE family subunit [Anaerolineales bacterium]
MLADIGFIALVLGFVAAVYSTLASIYGAKIGVRGSVWISSARNALITVWVMLSLSCGAMIWLLLAGDFQVEYVATVTSKAMPAYLKVTALWGGQAGSLLFWAWIASTFSALIMLKKWQADRALLPYMIAISAVTEVFFIGLVVFVETPFSKLDFVPLDGNGLSPLLRHPGMIIHPPMLYLGFVGFTIPYAFAMAALISGRLSDEWIRISRRWTLAAWLFLSLGLVLGGRWAYDVLGWGGYWAWDPVENAALLPWLTGTAFLHSVMIQEKRGMLKAWNMRLIIVTYILVILGTFLTRSGVISSVHAFARSAIGPLFLGFVSAMLFFSLYWLQERRDALSAEHQLDSIFSRETAFLVNNVLFLTITASVLIGTLFPLITELFIQEKITLRVGWYNQVVGPQLAALVFLMGVCPLLSWRRASFKRFGRAAWLPVVLTLLLTILLAVSGITNVGALIGFAVSAMAGFTILLEFWNGIRARISARGETVLLAFNQLVVRNRRRYGGYLIHLSMILMAIGITGSYFFQQETQGVVKKGETMTLGGFTVLYEGLDEQVVNRELTRSSATVSLYKDKELIDTLHPRQEYYLSYNQSVTVPAVRSTISEDFYVILVGWERVGQDQVTFKIYLNPLINWLWAGAILLIVGTLVAGWPEKRTQPVASVAYRPGMLLPEKADAS